VRCRTPFVAKPIEREALLDTIGALMNLAWASEESVV